MPIDEFKLHIDASDASRFGLCMFSPSIMAPLANRLLNQAYGDSGDNLSIPMGSIENESLIRYRAGNYSNASAVDTGKTIQVLESIPGAVMLITHAGVGASPAPTLGLLEHGKTRVFHDRVYSFPAFAEEHLSVRRVEKASELIEEFANFGITIQAQILTPGSRIQALLRTPWEAIFKEIIDNPESLFRFKDDPRAFEQFIADTYMLDGYEVDLTPRSNDGGVDIIARKSGFGSVKILDQAKAYSEHRRVSANDVRAAYGVLSMDRNASKVVITTTSNFSPGVYKEFAPFMPTRLDLRHGQILIDWLLNVKNNYRN